MLSAFWTSSSLILIMPGTSRLVCSIWTPCTFLETKICVLPILDCAVISRGMNGNVLLAYGFWRFLMLHQNLAAKCLLEVMNKKMPTHAFPSTECDFSGCDYYHVWHRLLDETCCDGQVTFSFLAAVCILLIKAKSPDIHFRFVSMKTNFK